jgi:hypothetical protein
MLSFEGGNEKDVETGSKVQFQEVLMMIAKLDANDDMAVKRETM